jgi:predicted house-cleaning noncanonical NTP pyrophosphatase (MazG superfamily)
MHNTPLANAEFRVAFARTNLRYINNRINDATPEELGELLELESRMIEDWEEAKKELARLRLQKGVK